MSSRTALTFHLSVTSRPRAVLRVCAGSPGKGNRCDPPASADGTRCRCTSRGRTGCYGIRFRIRRTRGGAWADVPNDLSSTRQHPDAELIPGSCRSALYSAATIRPGNSKGNPMARDSQAALVALNRFGLGARGGASGDFLNAASDPRGFVKAELARPNGVLLEVPGLQSTPALGKAVFDYQFGIQQARDAAARAAPSPATEGQPPPDVKGQRRNLSLNRIAMDMAPKEPSAEPAAKPPENRDTTMSPAETMRPNAPKPPPAPLNIIQKTFRAEALARLQRAVIADCGFTERLVVFWSNHFCISANKGGPARMWAGSFEREAIRPHVLGRFADMLKAVEQHPAMLFFLDNQQSLGPDSRAGRNRNRGLNENLAREIMELHTLGVGGGYLQDDVTSLARIITGWTYAGRQGQLGTPGTFVFNANAHQPG